MDNTYILYYYTFLVSWSVFFYAEDHTPSQIGTSGAVFRVIEAGI